MDMSYRIVRQAWPRPDARPCLATPEAAHMSVALVSFPSPRSHADQWGARGKRAILLYVSWPFRNFPRFGRVALARNLRGISRFSGASAGGIRIFTDTPYKHPQNGRTYRYYEMTRDGFTGAKAPKTCICTLLLHARFRAWSQNPCCPSSRSALRGSPDPS